MKHTKKVQNHSCKRLRDVADYRVAPKALRTAASLCLNISNVVNYSAFKEKTLSRKD